MDIFTVLEDAADSENAAGMSAYMKNKFLFLGISKPARAALCREFLKQKRQEENIDWDFIFSCYGKSAREFRYIALDYLLSVQNRLLAEDIRAIERLITTDSWWDTVDTLDETAGTLYLKYPETHETILGWMDSDNLWLRRVSINFQQKFKDKTDTDVLSSAILKNAGSKEFFINKAIGWSLREYSKTNPDWVRDFLARHALSPLSVREASKYL